ncbi:MAG: hypothetical protein M3N41_10235 [Acidobacteriota bacterium]|nr:hypothetical protein [Acidobacteriota bacterium]
MSAAAARQTSLPEEAYQTAYRFAQRYDPYDEHRIITEAAERVGLCDVRTRQHIEIDQAALPAEYLRKSPDYAKIRRHLEDGVRIPGAFLTRQTEYTLARIPGDEPDDERGRR